MYTFKIYKRFFFQEIKRFFLSPLYAIIFLTCMISFYIEIHDFGYFEGQIHYIDMSLSLVHWAFIVKILPLFLSIYVIMFMVEEQSGYSNLISAKLSKKRYHFIKYFTNFFISGLSIIIPYIIMELYLIISWKISKKELASSELMAHSNYTVKHYIEIEDVQYFYDLAQNKPTLYILLCVINTFLCCATIGTICLGLSKIIKNKILVCVSTFAIYVVLGMFSDSLFVGLSLINNLGFSFSGRKLSGYSTILLGYFVYFMIGTILYIFGDKFKERWG